MSYDLDRESALSRVREAGYGAGKWGSPASANPYRLKYAMQREAYEWEAGRKEGEAERNRGGLK